MPKSRSRPLGVTIMAIIVMLSAILTILAGLAALGLGIVLVEWSFPGLGALSGVVGIFIVVWGVVGFYVAKGLWALDKWAWTWSMIWLLVDAILNFIGNSYLSVLFAVIVMIYLYTKKDLFR